MKKGLSLAEMHLNEDDVNRYLDGGMPKEKNLLVAVHLDLCPVCAHRLDFVRKSREAMKEALSGLEEDPTVSDKED